MSTTKKMGKMRTAIQVWRRLFMDILEGQGWHYVSEMDKEQR